MPCIYFSSCEASPEPGFDELQSFRYYAIAGWSSLVARRAHNPKVVGSNPTPATISRFLRAAPEGRPSYFPGKFQAPSAVCLQNVSGAHIRFIRVSPCWIESLSKLVPSYSIPSTTHKAPHKLRNLICCGIEREMTCIEDVDFGLWHVPAIGVRFRKLERQIVFAPEDQKPRLLLAHPSLPLGIGVDVRAVVVEEVALNVGLAGLVEKGKFIGPEVRIIELDVGIVPDMARPGRLQRQEICAKRAFIRGAVGPEGPPRLPIRAQAFVVRHGILEDERLDPFRMSQGH